MWLNPQSVHAGEVTQRFPATIVEGGEAPADRGIGMCLSDPEIASALKVQKPPRSQSNLPGAPAPAARGSVVVGVRVKSARPPAREVGAPDL